MNGINIGETQKFALSVAVVASLLALLTGAALAGALSVLGNSPPSIDAASDPRISMQIGTEINCDMSAANDFTSEEWWACLGMRFCEGIIDFDDCMEKWMGGQNLK